MCPDSWLGKFVDSVGYCEVSSECESSHTWAHALLSRRWLQQEPFSPVKKMLEAGNLLAPRKRHANHILEDADRKGTSLAKLASSYFVLISGHVFI